VTQENRTAVDEYVSGLLVPPDEATEAALRASEAAGLPAIQVSPPQAKMLYLLARSIDAGSILEFGTLGAYSTIWLGRALAPSGRLLTLEADPRYAEVARANLAGAGLSDSVEVRVGPALEQLPALDAEGVGPFDFTFIDADKEHSPEYLAWALDRSLPGSLIVIDNVVRSGELVNPDSDDRTIPAQRRLHEQLAAEPRLEATTIQTVGSKGHDGFVLALVQSSRTATG
jgi:predicted O-methyltransferase YrrM